ncbi:MAG: SemiSWEET transporter [Ignavibacteriales bacterium]|nr:SemiSWEET transporter [Ignavibacteriales bacterium]
MGTTSSFIPQAYKVFKTKKTEDLSLGIFLLFCGGTVLWIIYGAMIKSFPVLLANSVTFVLAFYILMMKIKHR